MNIEATKLELIQMLLQTRKESLLSRLKKVFEEEQTGFTLSDEHYQAIDERRKAHLEGSSTSYSWEEVQQKIRNTAR